MARMLRDCTDSEKVNLLKAHAEVLFYRLMMRADDYGSFYANVKLIKSNCYPLRTDAVRDADIARWMDELQKAGLIVVYENAGKSYLRILNFGQRLRNKKKRFPDCPPELLINAESQQLAAAGSESPPEEEEELEEELELEEEGERAPAPHVFLNEGQIWNIETDLKTNQRRFEEICMAAQKNKEVGENSLTKYHLSLQEKEAYPRSRKSLYAGFQKWLMNEKSYSNAKPGASQVGKDFISD
jgi:hypothetical protein